MKNHLIHRKTLKATENTTKHVLNTPNLTKTKKQLQENTKTKKELLKFTQKFTKKIIPKYTKYDKTSQNT